MPAYPELAAIRLGYGLSPWADPPADPVAWVGSVASAAPDGDAFSMARDYLPHRTRYADLNRQGAQQDPAALQAVKDIMRDIGLRAPRIRVARAVGDGGFGERLVQFWADHFTVTAGNLFDSISAAAFVDEAIRPHLSGRFGDMLFAVATHPMMLIYLNQNASVGPPSSPTLL